MRYAARSDDFESFLDQMNDAVSVLPEPEPLQPPPISLQIVGLPRSGTTLLYQLLARSGRVGYPSNVMALFHRSPWVGARLQRHLAAGEVTLSTESLAGRTPQPLDPHEFGYFWRRVCGHDANRLIPDRAPQSFTALQHDLDLVATVFGAPTVYKNYLAITHAAQMRSEMDGVRFVVVTRPLEEVAASLLRLRERLDTDPAALTGVLPAQPIAPDLPLIDRIARQVVAVDAALAGSGLDPAADVMRLSCERVVADPAGAVQDVLRFLRADETAAAEAAAPTLRPGAGASTLDAQTAAALRRALDDANAWLLEQHSDREDGSPQ